jgi:hypothetical protein
MRYFRENVTVFQNLCVFETDLNMAKDIDIRNRENASPDIFVADIRSIIEQGKQ